MIIIFWVHQSHPANVKLNSRKQHKGLDVTVAWIIFCMRIVVVSASRLEEMAGEESLRLRGLFILPEARQPYGRWLTQRVKDVIFMQQWLLHAVVSAPPSAALSDCTFSQRVTSHPSIIQMCIILKMGFYHCKIGAQVTSRLLTGNGPWHLN